MEKSHFARTRKDNLPSAEWLSAFGGMVISLRENDNLPSAEWLSACGGMIIGFAE